MIHIFTWSQLSNASFFNWTQIKFGKVTKFEISDKRFEVNEFQTIINQ
jgi:hypothetical protein